MDAPRLILDSWTDWGLLFVGFCIAAFVEGFVKAAWQDIRNR